ncbi:MAG: S8 family serine peptidase, partial [Patescibacteria group bacterium]
MPKFFDIKSFGIDLTLGFWILTLWLVFVAPLPVRAQLLIESVPEPNDPLYFANQASYFGQIKLWDAWIKTTGSADVIIAIIDSGVDMDHPDLIGNMWFNKKEIPLNGVDDDNNGYVDDLNGWDFLENTSDPHPKLHDGKSFSGLNHGTVVAGIAAAATNNNEGLAGVCWSCKVMALRAVGGDGTGTTEKVALA